MDYSKWENINDSTAAEIAHSIASKGVDTIDSVYEESRKYSIV